MKMKTLVTYSIMLMGIVFLTHCGKEGKNSAPAQQGPDFSVPAGAPESLRKLMGTWDFPTTKTQVVDENGKQIEMVANLKVRFENKRVTSLSQCSIPSRSITMNTEVSGAAAYTDSKITVLENAKNKAVNLPFSCEAVVEKVEMNYAFSGDKLVLTKGTDRIELPRAK